MAANSWTYADAMRSFVLKVLLKKAMGWPFWDRTVPIPIPEAYVSKTNGIEKSGNRRIGADEIAFFNWSKAIWADWFQTKLSLVNTVVKGAAMEA